MPACLVAPAARQVLPIKTAERAGTSTRRAVLFGTGALVLAAPAVQARDLKKALEEKEARRNALNAAAEQIKETGADTEVFAVPEYSVPEESRTPNFHTRQDEGARKQNNI